MKRNSGTIALGLANAKSEILYWVESVSTACGQYGATMTSYKRSW
jgi:hypothetical protein